MSTCDCARDGFCDRYKKPMAGRLREICAGVNIDAGTASHYRSIWAQQVEEIKHVAPDACPHWREQVGISPDTCCGQAEIPVHRCDHPDLAPHQTTAIECARCPHLPLIAATPTQPAPEAKKLILKNHLSPGDVLVMSAAIHSLHRAHPGKFLTAVDTTANAVFEHNPDVADLVQLREASAEEISVHYPAIHKSNERGIHFMHGYCEFLSEVLGVSVPLLTNRPHVYLSKAERGWMDQVHEATGRKQRFWLINAGTKSDFTNKRWGTRNYQRVVDALRGRMLCVQVGSAEHDHPHLRGVLNLIGKTDQRQLVRLCWHADGVLTPTSFLMHLAAALEKPAVVVMGGREPVPWNSYPRQHLMHTVGALSCCKTGGCWRSRVEKLGDGQEQDGSLCEQPVKGESEQTIPRCMELIDPEEVTKKILLNYA